MNKVFNTPFELSLRILLLLENNEFNFEKIFVFDFITTYSTSFDIQKHNLHGENDYKFSEFFARKKIIQQAIKNLVLQNLIIPKETNGGFVYSTTQKAKQITNSMQTEYAREYKDIFDEVFNKYRNYSEIQLEKMITQKSLN